jgi:hypothetical protein
MRSGRSGGGAPQERIFTGAVGARIPDPTGSRFGKQHRAFQLAGELVDPDRRRPDWGLRWAIRWPSTRAARGPTSGPHRCVAAARRTGSGAWRRLHIRVSSSARTARDDCTRAAQHYRSIRVPQHDRSLSRGDSPCAFTLRKLRRRSQRVCMRDSGGGTFCPRDDQPSKRA